MKVYQIGGIGYDSNIYLILEGVVALVDAGTGINFNQVKANLGKLGLSPADIKLLINTHCHFDHTGGDWDFVNASGCELAIHESEAEALRQGDERLTLTPLFGARPKPLEPDRLLREGDRIKLGEAELVVLHTPGHSAGSICLYEPKEKALFSGDTVFCDGVGRTDLPSGDARALARSIRRLAQLEVERLFPGHGPFKLKQGWKHVKAALSLVNKL